MLKRYNQLIVAVMRLTDLAVTAGVWALCFHLRFGTGWVATPLGAPDPAGILDIVVVSLLATALVFDWLGLYRPRRIRTLRQEAFDVVLAVLIVWTAQLVIGHFLHSSPISRKLQGLVLVIWPLAMASYRLSARAVLRLARKRGHNLRSAAVVGAGKNAQKLVHLVLRQSWTGYRTQYLIDDDRAGTRFLGVPVRGPIAEVDRILREHPVDAVFVALPHHQSDRLDPVLNLLGPLLVDVPVVPDLPGHLLSLDVLQVGSVPLIHLTHNPQTGANALIKRLFDIAGSLLLLVLLAPLMLAIALAIRLGSRGPVFYRQRRASLGGHEFTILKFRSMVYRPETAAVGAWSTAPGDERVTRLGRVLRKLSLDELPQLLNVLTGSMSLVGPRPERPEFIERFGRQMPRYMLRHHVKAGITGWAQVHGFRGRTSLRKRLQYDLDYIQRWSLLLDLKILVLTLFRGFINRAE